MSASSLTEQRDRFRARTEYYRRLGYDRLSAARYVAAAGRRRAGRVLDVGTGKGLLAIAFAGQGRNVVSVDVSVDEIPLAGSLAAAEGLAERIRFLVADAAALPFPAASFETCAMMDVLHHLDDGASVLGEMARVLRPGGSLIVADFTPAGFDLVARAHASEGAAHPVGPVTMDWAEAFLAGLGLRADGAREGQYQRVSVFGKSVDGRD